MKIRCLGERNDMIPITVQGISGDNVKVLYCQNLSILVDYIEPYLEKGWKLSGGVCRTVSPPTVAYPRWMVTLVKEFVEDNYGGE